MDELAKLKKRITNTFKLSGFVIRSENSAFLAEQIEPLNAEEREKWLTGITDNLQGQRLKTTNVERTDLEKAIKDMSHGGLTDGECVFAVISAFRVPRFNYNTQTKKFDRDEKNERSIIANVRMKTRHLKERYAMLLQKTVRHELFAPAIIENGSSEENRVKKFKLQYAETLMASSTMKETVILGQLSQLVEGKFFVEDPTGSVELDLGSTRYHTGFFCDGCFVLAEGSYSDGILKVDGLGFPPAEAASTSRAFFGTQNSWGGESNKLLKYSPRLAELEQTNSDATIVFLSDVRLDLPNVMRRLRLLFEGYDACPPVAIVLMGPFIEPSSNPYALRDLFTALGESLTLCGFLKKSTDLVLIPSLHDPMCNTIMPRPALPETLVSGLRKVWPRTVLATNPCRLQYCSQQIVVCRLDLMVKFCRNTLHFPEDISKIDTYFARTLICQSHLLPMHPIVAPVHWDFDPALWLYPLPDLVVMGDSCKSFCTTQHGCIVLNTGSFIKSKFGFKVYIPATRVVEDSEIPDEVANA